MQIGVNVKSVYGSELTYISNPQIQEIIERLTGRKTLTDTDIMSLEALGHEVVEELPTRG
tara:strand:+ start:35 stop:214 length:180 start_codon:yes stop_codon:yes gene_type:complete